MDALRGAVLAKLAYAVGKVQADASDRDWFLATALAVRDRMVQGWQKSYHTTNTGGTKRVYYMSLEFLIGRLMFDALTNLGLTDAMRDALSGLGVDLDRLREVEPDAALGNGGLGRLAACYMESMATLSVAGLRLRHPLRDHGLFRQVIKDGWQQEYPENWLSLRQPLGIRAPRGQPTMIGFGGQRRAGHRRRRRLPPGPNGTPAEIGRGRRLRHPRRRLARPPRQHAPPVVRPRRPTRCGSTPSTSGDHVGALSARAKCGTPSAKVLYPSRGRPPPARSCACARSIFFSSASLHDLAATATCPPIPAT